MNSTDEATGDINGSEEKISKNTVLKSLVGEIRNLKSTMETTRKEDAAYRGRVEKLQEAHEKRQESLEQRQKEQAAHQKERAERERINSLAVIADNPIVDLEIRTKARRQVNAYWAKQVQVAADDDEE
jgi:hypothetical protein